MVLLDDSNSYWWLVRVVKDGSIGRSRALENPLNNTDINQVTSRRSTLKHLPRGSPD